MDFFGLSSEVQIVLAVVAFYLYDAALLLSYEEGLLLRDAGQWRVRFSTEGQYAARRFLHWPPLLQLHVQVHRLSWHSDRVDLRADRSAQAWEAAARKLRVLPPLAYLQGAAIAILLPLALFRLHSEAALLLVAGLIYLVALVQAICVWRGAAQWGLDTKAARAIAAEVLLCPPMGLNLVRKVSLRTPCRDNLLAAASTVLSDASFQDVRRRAVDLIEDELMNHDAGTDVALRLQRSIELLSRVQA